MIKSTGYLLYFGEEELRNEFDEFLVEYKKTDRFEDKIQREMNFDGRYIGPDIQLTGNGETITVAFEPSCFPRAFLNAGEKVPTGYDLEALKYFANEKNYQIDFVPTSFDDAIIGLFDGKYDAFSGYLSEEYAADARYYGLFTSMTMDEVPIYFVQKTQDKISVDLTKIEG